MRSKFLFLLVLVALMLMVACGGDENSVSWTTSAGLEWSDVSKKGMEWQDAKDYCEALGARLPTIDELRKIIINCPDTTYGGDCQVSDPDCLSNDCWTEICRSCDGSDAASFSALGDSIWLWSSSSLANKTTLAWVVSFDYGNVILNGKDVTLLVRCVR